MKHLRYILLAALMCTFSAQAQFTPITASEAHAAAQTSAAEKLTNPQLLGTATFSGEFEVPNFGQISMSFDISNGNGTLWGFMYTGTTKETETDTTISYVVGQILFAPVAFEVDIASLLPPEYVNFLAGPLQSDNWIDSPKLAENLRANNVLSTYLTSNGNPDAEAVVLSEVEVSIAPFTGTLWQAVWSGEGSDGMVCYVHAETGETYCESIAVGVDSDFAEDVTLAPNPTEDVVIVRGNIEHLTNCYIINASGQKVATVDASRLHNIDYGIGIPVSNLASGMYFVVLETEGGRALKPIEVQR